MATHLDEMQSYIKIAGSVGPPEDEILTEGLALTVKSDVPESFLIEDLNEVIFKLRSYRELNEDQSYALGMEEGFCQAAEMLGRVLEKYGRTDPDE